MATTVRTYFCGRKGVFLFCASYHIYNVPLLYIKRWKSLIDHKKVVSLHRQIQSIYEIQTSKGNQAETFDIR